MRFWDTSAIVPLLVDEPASPALFAELARDPDVIVWWATSIECASALARVDREGLLPQAGVVRAFDRLDALEHAWQEIAPVTVVRETAVRLLRVHPLRVADALQLGAAIVAAEGRPRDLELVTLDARLAGAALREGFTVRQPAPG